MALHLDHTIVPAYDKEESARFIARIFGLQYNGPWGHFAPVKINDILTLDFDNHSEVEPHHYAFLAADEEFDAILNRVKEAETSPTEAVRSPRTEKSTTCIKEEASTFRMQTGTAGKSLPTPTLMPPPNFRRASAARGAGQAREARGQALLHQGRRCPSKFQ